MANSQPAHQPVMVNRIVDLLSPALIPSSSAPNAPAVPAPVLVDCTLGLGGHAEALLTACPEARLIGLDRDPQALTVARERLAGFGDRVTVVPAVYHELPRVLDELGLASVQGVLMDLGLSSLQIDTAARGFAYAKDAPLDMRMGEGDLTADDVLNTYAERDLVRILHRYGEEKFAERIARRVVADRAREPFDTSARLVAVLHQAIPMAAQRGQGHPAKRTFQALRIEVNAELDSLAAAVPAAVAALAVGGRLAVLAYHSLEDRLVKQVLRAGSQDRAPRNLPVVPPELQAELTLLTRGAERPDDDEVRSNPRAASARLRAAMRIKTTRMVHQ